MYCLRHQYGYFIHVCSSHLKRNRDIYVPGVYSLKYAHMQGLECTLQVHIVHVLVHVFLNFDRKYISDATFLLSIIIVKYFITSQILQVYRLF